ncbi:MAG: hypothetical protein NZL85_12105, partial [Fimbriimonadales bacterium]|nr:hypothetical protein [Fimbriimonadales bacterium]
MEYLTAMGRWWLVGLLLGGMALQAWAQELERYLHLRRLHKVQSLTPIGALELTVGKRVLEVEGVVRGSIAVDEQRSVLLEVEPSRSLVIQISAQDSWLTRGQLRIRALVQVVRESALVTPTYRLIGAIHASVFARYEAEERARQRSVSQVSAYSRAAASPPPSQARPSRNSPPARGKSLASRGAPPQTPTITDWQ